MKNISHLNLSARKRLCACIIIGESLFSKKMEFIKEGREKRYIAAKTLFPAMLDKNAEAIENCKLPLEHCLKQIFDEYIKYFDPLVEGLPPIISEEIGKAIKVRVGNLSCAKCDRICNGSDADGNTVSKNGYCIAPILHHFRLAGRYATQYYKKYSSQIQGINFPEVDLSTAFTADTPHDFPVNCHVSGATIFEDSIIKLCVCLEKFGWQTYLAVPYVFFHEWICHAFENICAGEDEREYPEPTDPFSEGWMDWIACEIMIKLQGSESSLSFEHIDIAEKFHMRRTDYQSKQYTPSPNSSRYHYGKDVARKLFSLIQNVIPNKLESWALLLQISFDLCVLPIGIGRIERFLDKLHRGIIPNQINSPHSLVAYRSSYSKIKKIIQSFALDRDTENLLKQILMLS